MSYIIAPEGLSVGDCIFTKENIVFRPGNATYIQNIPIGVRINSIALFPNSGAQFIRAAGTYATVVTKSINMTVVKLKSGELRRVLFDCMATIGAVSNFRYMYRSFRKAGAYRLMGWRPVVRGVAMNPVDHPHGGGQGKTSGGRPSVTPWGIITKGQPTKKKRSVLIMRGKKF
jgi:large subunit ribosomal protein L2